MERYALEYLVGLGGESRRPIHETDSCKTFLTQKGEIFHEARETNTICPVLTHQKDFVRYLLTEPLLHHDFEADGPAPVYLVAERFEQWPVSSSSTLNATCDLSHGFYGGNQVSLQMLVSPELVAFSQFCARPCSQAELWKGLVTRLHGCFSPSLAMQIGALRTELSDKSQIKINPSGLASQSGEAQIGLAVAGGKTESAHTLDVEWTWTGRILAAWEPQFSIPCRLVASLHDGQLQFQFHARHPEQVLANAVEDVREYLEEAFDKTRFPVFLA